MEPTNSNSRRLVLRGSARQGISDADLRFQTWMDDRPSDTLSPATWTLAEVPAVFPRRLKLASPPLIFAREMSPPNFVRDKLQDCNIFIESSRSIQRGRKQLPCSEDSLATPNDFTLTIIRLVLGGLVFIHGAQKVVPGWWGGPGFSGTHDGYFYPKDGHPGAAGVSGDCRRIRRRDHTLIIGLLGRVAAMGIITVMIVAIFKVSAQFGLFMNWSGKQAGEGYEYHLLAIALALAIFFRGLRGAPLTSNRLLMRSPPPAP